MQGQVTFPSRAAHLQLPPSTAQRPHVQGLPDLELIQQRLTHCRKQSSTRRPPHKWVARQSTTPAPPAATAWKFKSMTDQRTDGRTDIGMCYEETLACLKITLHLCCSPLDRHSCCYFSAAVVRAFPPVPRAALLSTPAPPALLCLAFSSKQEAGANPPDSSRVLC